MHTMCIDPDPSGPNHEWPHDEHLQRYFAMLSPQSETSQYYTNIPFRMVQADEPLAQRRATIVSTWHQ